MEDGVIKMKTKELSEANHLNADQLLDEITNLAGGTRQTEQIEHEFWKTRNVIRQNGRVKIVKN